MESDEERDEDEQMVNEMQLDRKGMLERQNALSVAHALLPFSHQRNTLKSSPERI